MNYFKIFVFISIWLTSQYSIAQNESRLLRFPTINENTIVFTYAGDLYSVARTGGTARKITNDSGYEMFARFSPDGKQLAFSGQYDGNTEVYVIPADGGVPKRLTFTATLNRDDISDRMGPNNIVMTWTKDSKNIIYRSRKKTFNDFIGQLFSVSVNGGLSEELPLPSGGFCSYSPDGKKLAYNRVFREFRTWKYYKGGMADDVWIYDFDSKKVEDITNTDSQDIFPMWFADEIFYLSDRDRTMNMFCYNTKTNKTTKVTDFKEYDIKFPSAGNDAIVFENAGYLYVFDIKTKKYDKISIIISDDFISGRNELKDASKNINTTSISPDGNRLVFSARGDIFTIPAKSGITRNITKSSGAHDRGAVWSPDGKFIAYLSDMSGEYEIYIQKQDGSEKPVQITKNADTYKYTIKWSPDSKKILFNDKMLRLQFVDIDTKDVTLVELSDVWEFNSFNWSPDSKWITYSKPEKNNMHTIWLYSTDSKEKIQVTDTWYQSDSPMFSDDGKFLYFTSSRDFNPIYSETEWNHAYKDMEKIYFVTLLKDTKSPFAPENNEVNTENKDEGETKEKDDSKNDSKKNNDNKENNPKKDQSADKQGKKEESKKIKVKIDKEGIQQRIASFPVKASGYRLLASSENCIYYIDRSYNNPTSLKIFNLKDKKETVLGDFNYGTLSFDKKKMMLNKAGKYYIIDTPKDEPKLKDPVDLSNMKVIVNNNEEWLQIYNESWRQMRDFFYVPNMHGVNWKAMHDKYAVLLPFINNRNDLNYIIGELIGELNIGHAYVGGGDKPAPEKILLGLLGATITMHTSGYYQINKILKGENWDKNMRSPLTEIGVNVKEGDYIIAVNGELTKNMNDFYESMINMANKPVELTINSTPDEKGSTKTIVVPIGSEEGLYYFNWVQNNIEKVNKATNDQVGYIHIPDMDVEGLNEFVKYFYPQLSKKALIIDDRGNGGGNVSPMILERLQREITRANMSRNVPNPGFTPKQMMLGPKVLLINNYSASDGDLFPYGFKKYKLGKVVGMRTWGGVVGIRGSLPFIDGGTLSKPEFASYSSETGQWIIEGYGVDPDVVVDNDPAKEYAGEDQQLNKAIEIILEELKNYKEIPAIPPGPDKSK